MNVRELEPKIVWNFFEDLNAVPRPSKKEEKIIEKKRRDKGLKIELWPSKSMDGESGIE